MIPKMLVYNDKYLHRCSAGDTRVVYVGVNRETGQHRFLPVDIDLPRFDLLAAQVKKEIELLP